MHNRFYYPYEFGNIELKCVRTLSYWHAYDPVTLSCVASQQGVYGLRFLKYKPVAIFLLFYHMICFTNHEHFDFLII